MPTQQQDFSFLICFHDNAIDVFLSGMPVGVVKNGQFKLHQVADSKGNPKDISMENFKHLPYSKIPFETIEELKEKLIELISLINLKK